LPGAFPGDSGARDVRSAPTLYGHDLHLDRRALESGPAAPDADADASAPPPAEPAAALSTEPITREEVAQRARDDEITLPPRQRVRSHHSGKSRFPALARLFGRWNTQGHLEERAARDLDDDFALDAVPRERFLRPLAIVVATASISFFIVVTLLKLRDSPPETPPAPAPVAAPLSLPPPTPAPAARPVVIPQSPPVAAPTAAAPVMAPPAAPPAVAQPAEPPAPVAKRPVARRRARRAPADPDSPMPLSF
jgi:hypothetical protein